MKTKAIKYKIILILRLLKNEAGEIFIIFLILRKYILSLGVFQGVKNDLYVFIPTPNR
jgi:hypothetical protein